MNTETIKKMEVTPDPFGPGVPLCIERLAEEVNRYKGLTCTPTKMPRFLVGGYFRFCLLPEHRWTVTITDGKRSKDFYVTDLVSRHGIDVEYAAKKFVLVFDDEGDES